MITSVKDRTEKLNECQVRNKNAEVGSWNRQYSIQMRFVLPNTHTHTDMRAYKRLFGYMDTNTTMNVVPIYIYIYIVQASICVTLVASSSRIPI